MQARNKIEIAVRSLLLGASVVITAAIVSLGIFELSRAKGLAAVTGGHLSELTEDIKNSDILQYDGITVTGSEVVNFCKKHLGSVARKEDNLFIITVVNDAGSISYTYADELDKQRDVGSGAYIKPTWFYCGEVLMNGNNVITQVIFTKTN